MMPFFVNMMPVFLPEKELLIVISGVVEILFGNLILIPQWNNYIAWAIILLLVAMFPSNMNMALSKKTQHNIGITPVAGWIRMFIQFLFVVWAYQLTDLPVREILSFQY
jgi:uncharacterized membrane protein